MIPRFPVYLFDIDGTLLDSAADICGAVEQVLALKPPSREISFEYLKGFIGLHLIDLFTEVYPDYSPQQIDSLILQYRSNYLARGRLQPLEESVLDIGQHPCHRSGDRIVAGQQLADGVGSQAASRLALFGGELDEADQGRADPRQHRAARQQGGSQRPRLALPVARERAQEKGVLVAERPVQAARMHTENRSQV